MKTLFKKFGCHADWNSFDHLGGIRIEHGDKIKIQWPDKTTEMVKVSVIHTTETVSDMGIPASTHHSKAYADITHRGQKIPIRLIKCGKIRGQFVTDVSKRKIDE